MPFNTIQQAEVDAMLGCIRNPPTTAYHLARIKDLQALAHLKYHMNIVRRDRQILRELQYDQDLFMRHGCAPFQLYYYADRVAVQKDIIHRNMEKLYEAIGPAATAEQAFKVYVLAN